MNEGRHEGRRIAQTLDRLQQGTREWGATLPRPGPADLPADPNQKVLPVALWVPCQFREGSVRHGNKAAGARHAIPEQASELANKRVRGARVRHDDQKLCHLLQLGGKPAS